MAKKIRVGVLFGGKSAEHEVSLQSAKNIVEAIDQEKFEVVLIGIDKQGQWFLNDASKLLPGANSGTLPSVTGGEATVTLIPESKGGQLVRTSDQEALAPVDVIFPILHGPMGEDGTVQGLLKLADVPFVGAGVLGSAVGMDKDVMKRLLRDARIPMSKFLVVEQFDSSDLKFESVSDELGLPFFVKPANLGSSVGISRVNQKSEFDDAVNDAFRYDRKILIEEFGGSREIECSVLGNEEPIASVLGEIIPQDDFYSYEAKYLDETGAILKIPADLSEEEVKVAQALAIRVYRVLCCEGMARVDLFMTDDGDFLVNEINTIPGFTRISMYPKLWEASGISYAALIDRLIQLAIERFEKEKKLETSR